MFDTTNPLPRSEGERRQRHRTAAFKNIGVGLGGLGVGYAGLRAGGALRRIGTAAAAVEKSTPAYVGSKTRDVFRKFWEGKLKSQRFHSLLREIHFASGDIARKYLPFEPLLARRGEEGYDPYVERETKAALTHHRPLTEAQKKARGRELGKTAVLKSGYAPKEIEPGGKRRYMPLVKIERPYREIRSKMSQMFRGLTQKPKEPELPPPEMLPSARAKTPVKGGEYKGVSLPENLWDPEEAKKSALTKVTYISRQHPHQRAPLTPGEISAKAQAFRDPLASHRARVKAGLTPSLIEQRAEHTKNLPDIYLPHPVAQEERRQAQALRDYLAGQLKGVRKDIVQPLRAKRRKILGQSPLKGMTGSQKKALWSASEAMGTAEIAPGYLGKPAIKPMVPIGGGAELHPKVVSRLHQQLKSDIARRTAHHEEQASKISDYVQKRMRETFDTKQVVPELRKAGLNLHTSTFGPQRTLKLEDWEAKSLAEHAGTTPEFIKQQHKQFLHHSHLTTGAGEKKIRGALMLGLFKRVPAEPDIVPKATYPILIRIGKGAAVGIGAATAAGLGTYLYRRQRSKEKRFAVQDKDRDNTLPHDVAIGGIEGGLGYLATDKLIKKLAGARRISPLGRFGLAAGVGGVATGTIGYALNRVVRQKRMEKMQKAQGLSSRLREIRFDSEGYNTLYNPKRRLTVAQDRYRKAVREREILRKEANLGKSALAGGVLAGVLARKKFGLARSIVGGAAAGLGSEAALIMRGRAHRDPFGEENISSKRIERIPYQAAGLATAGIAARHLYKKRVFRSRQPLIQFQQFIPADKPDKPWLSTEAGRWLRHPKSRTEAALKWTGRVGRLQRDINLPRDKQGKVIDERGRVREPEWKKTWVTRAAVTGLVVGGALGARKLGGALKKSASTGAELIEKGFQPSQSERLALNLTGGGAKMAIKQSFPHVSGGMGRLGKLGSELRQIKESVAGRVNKAIEARTGRIESAKVHWVRDPETHEVTGIKGVTVNYPGESAEALKRLQGERERVQRKSESLRRIAERTKKSTIARKKVEDIIKAPEEKFKSKSKLIHFDEVYVRPHTRAPRRGKKITERSSFREGALIGGGIGALGTGAGVGYAWRATRQSSAQKLREHIEKRIAEEEAKRAAGKVGKDIVKIVKHSALGKVIEFRESTEKRRAKWGAISGGISGGVAGAGIGAYSSLFHPEVMKPYMKNIASAASESMREGLEELGGAVGEGWKGSEHQKPFGRRSPFSSAERAARLKHTEERLARKLAIRRVAKHAGIGATTLGSVGALGGYATARAGTHQRQLSAILDDLINLGSAPRTT